MSENLDHLMEFYLKCKIFGEYLIPVIFIVCLLTAWVVLSVIVKISERRNKKKEI